MFFFVAAVSCCMAFCRFTSPRARLTLIWISRQLCVLGSREGILSVWDLRETSTAASPFYRKSTSLLSDANVGVSSRRIHTAMLSLTCLLRLHGSARCSAWPCLMLLRCNPNLMLDADTRWKKSWQHRARTLPPALPHSHARSEMSGPHMWRIGVQRSEVEARKLHHDLLQPNQHRCVLFLLQPTGLSICRFEKLTLASCCMLAEVQIQPTGYYSGDDDDGPRGSNVVYVACLSARRCFVGCRCEL